jgi:hypothetical protein
MCVCARKASKRRAITIKRFKRFYEKSSEMWLRRREIISGKCHRKSLSPSSSYSSQSRFYVLWLGVGWSLAWHLLYWAGVKLNKTSIHVMMLLCDWVWFLTGKKLQRFFLVWKCGWDHQYTKLHFEEFLFLNSIFSQD